MTLNRIKRQKISNQFMENNLILMKIHVKIFSPKDRLMISNLTNNTAILINQAKFVTVVDLPNKLKKYLFVNHFSNFPL